MAKNNNLNKRSIKDVHIGRDEFSRRFAEKFGCSIENAKKILECWIDTATEILLTDGGFKFVGFGTLWVDKREAKKGRNPKTGEVIPIPPRNFVKFDSTPEFKKLIQ
jgi:DNA-binding protein HU-beta